ncbi:uncharacterized protein LOC128775918 [Panthera pardus]|uniref:Uncharacterized protein LOC128775918 n=1 Tax=Panthera pardus TaxID=9691 RepID=A0A9W2V8W8_PANPR|nr:uncharacterized protein LOC128775918 [Panthera pardus]
MFPVSLPSRGRWVAARPAERPQEAVLTSLFSARLGPTPAPRPERTFPTACHVCLCLRSLAPGSGKPLPPPSASSLAHDCPPHGEETHHQEVGHPLGGGTTRPLRKPSGFMSHSPRDVVLVSSSQSGAEIPPRGAQVPGNLPPPALPPPRVCGPSRNRPPPLPAPGVCIWGGGHHASCAGVHVGVHRRPCHSGGGDAPCSSAFAAKVAFAINTRTLPPFRLRARLATVIVREGTRFRLTREGWLLFLVRQSWPTAALASPCTTPASHTLGGAPARGGRCAAPGQPWKAARHLDRSGQPRIGRAPLLLTALVQRDWATQVPGWGPPWLSHHPWFHLPLMPRASAN